MTVAIFAKEERVLLARSRISLSGSVEAERFLGYTPEFGDSALSLEACSVTVGSEVR